MDVLSGRSAFSYSVTEEGDFLFFGRMPDYPNPESTPWFAESRRILRVVAGEGSSVGANGLSRLPALRVADLSRATEIGPRALAECPRLFAIVLSPSLERVASSAFSDCCALRVIDFSGPEEELMSLLPPTLPLFAGTLVRTVRPAEGEEVISGEVGGGSFCLTDDGTLTVDGASLPDCRHPMDMPWYPHGPEVRRVVFGERMRRIGAHALDGMTAVSEVLVTGRTVIAPFAFSSCHTLRDITVFGTVTEVGVCAFAGTGVGYALAPPSLSHIPKGLYDSCRRLKILVLPAVGPLSAERFLGHCRARLRFLGTKEEYRALPSPVRATVRRAVCIGHKKGASRSDLRLLEIAVCRGSTAEQGARLAKEALNDAEEQLSGIDFRIELAEAAYLTAETRRLGFTESFDGSEYKNSRRRRRAERRWIREQKKEAAAELCEEKNTATEARKRIGSLTKTLQLSYRRTRELERSVGRARRVTLRAERRSAALYPLGVEERRRVAAQAALLDALEKGPKSDALATAVERSVLYGRLLTYRRFDDVRAGMADLLRLLSDIRAEEETDAALSTVSPRILVAGAPPLDDPATDACMRALHRAGAVPVLAEDRVRRGADLGYDALVIVDGPPVNPFLYSERRHSVWDKEPLSHMDGVDAARDARDYDLFSDFYRYGKPVLGIGRGLHLINVAQGGTIFRQLPNERLEVHCKEKGDMVHEIEILPKSFLYRIYEPTVRPARVAGNHICAIRELGRELKSVAHASDGTVEAVAHEYLPIAGVQFLPERMILPHNEKYALPLSSPDDGRLLFSWFVQLAKEVRAKPLSSYAADRFSEE